MKTQNLQGIYIILKFHIYSTMIKKNKILETILKAFFITSWKKSFKKSFVSKSHFGSKKTRSFYIK
jgi:hypothetical protein